jgi:cellulose synthase/poly-beta-1,6-N-acetylglucosamine synthase-like glycosyltransferase
LAAAAVMGAALAVFALRRLVLLGAALLPVRRHPSIGTAPTAVVLVAARDEGAGIDPTLDALSRLDYPPERLSFILVDDGSEDDTVARMRRWAAVQPGANVLHLPGRMGKSAALAAALAAGPDSALVVVCDADLVPRPDWLRRLAEAFSDEDVGAAAPFLEPVNATFSAVARYAAVESWVHQLVTSAGKEALGLNPATNGASAYRRGALVELGGFPAIPSGEDVWITAALTRAGWRTRWVPDAVVGNAVANRWRDYIRQHLRWSRNLLSAGGARPPAHGPPSGGRAVTVARRFELRVMSLGYVDRLAFAAAIALAATGQMPLWAPLGYAGVIAAQFLVALARAGVGRAIPRYLLVTVSFYVLDVAASAASVAFHLLGRPRRWGSARRIPAPDDGGISR